MRKSWVRWSLFVSIASLSACSPAPPSSSEALLQPQNDPGARAVVDKLSARFTMRHAEEVLDKSSGRAQVVTREHAVPLLRTGVMRRAEPIAGELLRPQLPDTAYRYVPRHAEVLLPARADGRFQVKDADTGLGVWVRMADTLPIPAQVAGGYVVYAGAHASGADLLHRVTATGTEDYLHFERAPEKAEVRYTVELSPQVAGLRLVDDALEVLDAGGAPRVRVSRPYLIGADGKRTDAHLTVSGCAVDTSVKLPWGRATTPPGASACSVQVAWDPARVAYPALLDPSWEGGPSLGSPREQHTATRLRDGRVLIVGGIDGSTGAYLATALIYDPRTRTVAGAGSMGTARTHHTATQVIDGNLHTSTNTVLVAGGENASGVLTSMETWDPANGWRPAGNLQVGRALHTADALFNGQIVFTGGKIASGADTASTEWRLFNGTQVTGPDMSTPRRSHVSSVINLTQILVANGDHCTSSSSSSCTIVQGSTIPNNDGWGLNTAEILSGAGGPPANAVWFSAGTTLTRRRNVRAVSMDAAYRIMLVGAPESLTFNTGPNAEFLSDVTTGTWSAAPGLREVRDMELNRLVDGTLITTGAQNLGAVTDFWVNLYNPTANTWSAGTDLPVGRTHHSATLLAASIFEAELGDHNGEILVAGGSPALSDILLYNPGYSNGTQCGVDADCSSGHCVGAVGSGVNGVCCNLACSDPNTQFSCTTGTCQLNGCLNGYSNCDGTVANGCETNTTNNTTGANCGGCGAAFACSTANASGATCSGGVCQPSCNAGFQHCTGNVLTTGCETNITTLANCGACGNACAAATCANPVCQPQGAGFACVNVPSAACNLPNCALAACKDLDSDGDGLQDTWETNGFIDVNCNGLKDADGVDVWLPNADKDVPDLYVEIDWMAKNGVGGPCSSDGDCTTNGGVSAQGEQCISGQCKHTHKPSDAGIQMAQLMLLRDETPSADLAGLFPPGTVFKSPSDPTFRHGVRLHIDAGHATEVAETNQVVSFGDPANPTDWTLDTIRSCVGPDAIDLFQVKKSSFFPADDGTASVLATREARRRVYHYALFAHTASCPTGSSDPESFCKTCPADRSNSTPLSSATGAAELPGNDLIIALGQLYFDQGRARTAVADAGTFLHELGHNMSLDHGVIKVGADTMSAPGPLKSPNYLSVMNYTYQVSGVIYRNPSTGGFAVKPDYGDTLCSELNESHLNEVAGPGCPSTGTAYYEKYWTGASTPVTVLGTATNVDYNKNTIFETDAPGELSGNNYIGDDHFSQNDWDYDPTRPGNHFKHLSFEIGCNPWTVADGAPPISALSTSELTVRDVIASGLLPPKTDARVEVRPGCPTHWIATSSPTPVPLVVYSDPGFDATTIVPSSFLFSGEVAQSTTTRDVDGDGRLDMIGNFVMSGLGLAPSATSAIVSGNYNAGNFLQNATFTQVPTAGPVVTPKADANGFSGTMWAVNNQQQSWNLSACVTTAVDRCGVTLSPLTNGTITKITNDEKGNNQMFITGNATFSLAKNRDGGGDGRVYTVYYTIRDSIGNGTTGSCKFEVRHDNPGVPAIDSGTKTCVGSCP